MSEFVRPETQEEFDRNFGQLKPTMNATMAYYESSRCLFCYDAPCITACPTGIDIPLFIRQINTENIKGAARTIYASNYFGNICGKVCPTEVLCEGACVYNEQDVKPIEIGRLQSFATTSAMKGDISISSLKKNNGRKVAVIGAGPAGIACACELRNEGYAVDIFEAKSHPSGLALYGTAPYKITNQEVKDEVSFLQTQFGFNITYNHSVDSKAAFEKLELAYDAICLGIGLGETRSTNIEGENLKNCLGATEFIETLKMNSNNTFVGKKVIVIGGGNTAMDAASESARMGADQVTLLYRRSKEEMGAYDFEYELAKSVGVQAIFNSSVIKINGNETIKSITCVKTKNEGNQLVQIPNSEYEMECDMVIRATGQMKMTSLYDLIGLQYDQKGRIQTDKDTFQCNIPKYFAAGDSVNGGAEVVNACAEGKKAAQGIHQYLNTK